MEITPSLDDVRNHWIARIKGHSEILTNVIANGGDVRHQWESAKAENGALIGYQDCLAMVLGEGYNFLYTLDSVNDALGDFDAKFCDIRARFYAKYM